MFVGELGRFVAETRFEDLPSSAVGAAKMRILDLVTAAMVGFRIGTYRPLFQTLGDREEATIFGEGVKVPLRDAVLTNSFMAHSVYFEDGSRFTGGHPSSVVIPAALSLGEVKRSNGKEVLLSVVLGYDVFIRLGKAIYPSTVLRGFQSTAVLGALASAAACSSLLKLDREKSKNALAIACNLGVGLKAALKTPYSQPIQVGRSCEGGLLAALFAGRGAPGSDTIIEDGFLKAFADHPNKDRIVSGLGQRYFIEETYIKIHAGCRGNHAPIDAIQDLMKKHEIRPEEIREIRVKVDSVTMAGSIPEPRDGAQAQLSIGFSVAAAVVEGNASIYQYTDEKVRDPRIRSMMAKIFVEIDKDLDEGYPDKRGARGEILLKDGRRFSTFMEMARGEPEIPLSAREIEEKFFFFTREILGSKADKICEQVRQLETLPNIGELVRNLKAGPGRYKSDRAKPGGENDEKETDSLRSTKQESIRDKSRVGNLL